MNKIIIILLLFLLVSCGASQYSTIPTPQSIDEEYKLDNYIYQYVDIEHNVICYVYLPKGTMHCLKMEE